MKEEDISQEWVEYFRECSEYTDYGSDSYEDNEDILSLLSSFVHFYGDAVLMKVPDFDFDFEDCNDEPEINYVFREIVEIDMAIKQWLDAFILNIYLDCIKDSDTSELKKALNVLYSIRELFVIWKLDESDLRNLDYNKMTYNKEKDIFSNQLKEILDEIDYLLTNEGIKLKTNLFNLMTSHHYDLEDDAIARSSFDEAVKQRGGLMEREDEIIKAVKVLLG